MSDYLDKAVAMLNTQAFRNLCEGRISMDQYIAIRNQPPRKPFVPVLVINNGAQ